MSSLHHALSAPLSSTSQLRVAGAIAAAGLTLASCAQAEPVADPAINRGPAPVVFGVDKDSERLQIVAEMYVRSLGGWGVPAELKLIDADSSTQQLESINTGQVTATLMCTGPLVEELHADAARDLKEDVKDGRDGDSRDGDEELDDAELVGDTYALAKGALPSGFDAPDPSQAEACDPQEDDVLPHNIVPVYRKTDVDRESAQAMSQVNNLLETSDLEELEGKLSADYSPADAAQDWLVTQPIKMGSGSDEGKGEAESNDL